MVEVIVVDDEKMVLDTILDLMAASGITALGCDHPDAALQLVREENPEVMIADFMYYNKRGFTGLELLAGAKSIRPALRTILMSGYIDHSKLPGDTVEREAQARRLCDRYVAKPGIAPLPDLVQELLSERKRTATDWGRIAAQYVAVGTVSVDDVRELNVRIKENLIESAERGGSV